MGLCAHCKKGHPAPQSEDTIEELREIADAWKKAPKSQKVYFPPKEGKEVQPFLPEGWVSKRKVADLLQYIADMME